MAATQLHVRAERLQVHPVGDRADHQRAQQGRPGGAAPAKQAGSVDDGGRDGAQQLVAAAGGLVDGDRRDAAITPPIAPSVAAAEDDQPDPRERDARPPGRLGVAADGVDVPAERRAPGDEVDHDHDPDEDQHRQRHAAVVVEHGDGRQGPDHHHGEQHEGDDPAHRVRERVGQVEGSSRP
jgi:hypothetical protein